jgi:hypothetical protein
MLTGNLRTMGLPEILQWIAIGRKTGTLVLQRGSIQKKISFDEGTVHSSWSNDPAESLGQFLVRGRKVTEEQLFKALLKQEELGRPLGTVLVGDGVLDEDTLRESLRAKAEETIFNVFLWREGQFEFKDGDPPVDVPVHLDLTVQAVVMEGIRRVDEWERIRTVFPSRRATFAVTGSPDSLSNPVERQALQLAAAGRTLSAIALELRRSEFDAAAVLFELYQRGLLAVEGVGEEEPDDDGGDPIESIRGRLASAYRHMQERRYDAAQRDYEAVLEMDRLNQNAKKGLIAVSDARRRDRATRSVRLDMVPHLAVDLATLTRQNFDPQEGFVLSRVNGAWDVQSILKLCPMAEQDALAIFARLMERGVIELRER